MYLRQFLPTHITGGGGTCSPQKTLSSVGPSLRHTWEVSWYLERQRPSPEPRQETQQSQGYPRKTHLLSRW